MPICIVWCQCVLGVFSSSLFWNVVYSRYRLDHTKVISIEKKSTNFISGRCFRTSFSLNPAPKNIFITPLRFQQTLTHSQPLSLATLSVIACRRFDFHKHNSTWCQNNVAATNQINLYFPFSANSFPSSSAAFPPFPRVQSLRAASQTWSLPRGHQPTQPTPILLSSRSFLLHLQVPRSPLEGGERNRQTLRQRAVVGLPSRRLLPSHRLQSAREGRRASTNSKTAHSQTQPQWFAMLQKVTDRGEELQVYWSISDICEKPQSLLLVVGKTDVKWHLRAMPCLLHSW